MAKEVIVKQRNYNAVPRFILEKYRGTQSRYQCPSCRKKHSFTRFIDITTGDYVGEEFGRCNRIERCGYLKAPKGSDVKDKELFIPSSQVKKEFITEVDRISLIDPKFVVKSLCNYNKNNFVKFLLKHFDSEQVFDAVEKYRVGTSSKWKGATVFWQIDSEWDARTGKRVKEPYNHITWVHNPDKDLKEKSYSDFNLKQCFFGEFLINDDVDICAIVESEKTAIMGYLMNPQITWLATGGLQNINEERMLPLKGKTLVFYPDKGIAYQKWCEKLEVFKDEYIIKVSDYLEKQEELKDGEDLADLILLNLKKQ